jgi:cytochrome c-type biogenesis protein CcmH/NrfG
MKKETVILIVVIAFLVGFAIGATVGILYMINRGAKGVEKAAIVQRPQMAPPGAPAGAPAGAPPARDSIEVASQIQTLKEIIKKDPKNLPAWVELGNLYFDTDQPKEAIEAYSHYLAVKPDNPDVRTDIGIMYRKLGQFDRALEEFRKAAQSDPKHVNSRYNIGLVLLHDKQDIKGAIKAWEEYLKVDPNSERAQRIRAQIEKMKSMPAPSK